MSTNVIESKSVERVVEDEDEPHKRRTPKVIKIPRRQKSAFVPEPRKMIMTAGIKPKPIKLRQCLTSPLTLYELAAAVVDKFDYPQPFEWNEVQVADWMGDVVGLPQYKSLDISTTALEVFNDKQSIGTAGVVYDLTPACSPSTQSQTAQDSGECIIQNHINGRRLLWLEDSSVLPEINIHDFEHIKKITAAVRKMFFTDYVLFARSVGLPFRKPLTYCTWFKSRTGPRDGIRQNWSRSDILRWMKILLPKPVHLDHWDLVWYLKPDCPIQMVARISKADQKERIPQYIPSDHVCNEYMTKRKFILDTKIPSEEQYIWLEHLPGSPSRVEVKKKIEEEKERARKRKAYRSRLVPEKISLTGLVGRDLILARRKMAKPKFNKYGPCPARQIF